MPMLLRSVTKHYTLILTFLLPGLSACTEEMRPGDEVVWRAADLRAGTAYIKAASFSAPKVERLRIPDHLAGLAVWGATGRDDTGNIYFGLSAGSEPDRTGTLLVYEPGLKAVSVQGTVNEQLDALGMAPSGAAQAKIHSKIYQADDGFLYFASMDEEGETDTRNPKWGGHLWRKLPGEADWEHLFAASEALIAVNSDGRYVYALGYWEHVLYQFDTRTETVRRATVGSVPGHVSRNFLVDDRGHAYVPRVHQDASGEASADLCEYDPQMLLVSCNPIEGYFPADREPDRSQGIVAYTRMRNGSIAFVTGADNLQVLNPDYRGAGAATVDHHGPMHPHGVSEVKSLFTFEGESLLAAVGRSPKRKGGLDWIVYELNSGVASATALSLEALELRKTPTLYGSATKDSEGAFYVAGRVGRTKGHASEPIILRLYH